MPGPRGVITVNGNMESSLRIEEHTAVLAAEVYGGLIKPDNSSDIKANNISKRVRSAHKSVDLDID